LKKKGTDPNNHGWSREKPKRLMIETRSIIGANTGKKKKKQHEADTGMRKCPGRESLTGGEKKSNVQKKKTLYWD